METGEDIVWCKAACGQNFHKECFEKWRASRGGVKVTCVYCRAEWLEDGQSLPKKPAPGSLASLKETAPTILGTFPDHTKHWTSGCLEFFEIEID